MSSTGKACTRAGGSAFYSLVVLGKKAVTVVFIVGSQLNVGQGVS